MHGPAVEHIAEVLFCRRLFLWVDEVEEGLADEGACLLVEMIGEEGREVEEAEVGGEEGPVCRGQSECRGTKGGREK